jgi:hypothetical protein
VQGLPSLVDPGIRSVRMNAIAQGQPNQRIADSHIARERYEYKLEGSYNYLKKDEFCALGGSVFDLYNISEGVVYASSETIPCLCVELPREVDRDDANRESSEWRAFDRTIRCAPLLSSCWGLFNRPLLVASLYLDPSSSFFPSSDEMLLLLAASGESISWSSLFSRSSSSDDHAMTGNCMESCCCCMDAAAWNSLFMSNFRLELECVAIARGGIALLQRIVAKCSRASVAGWRG